MDTVRGIDYVYAGVPLTIGTLTLLKWVDDQGRQQNFCLDSKVSSKWKEIGGQFEREESELEGWSYKFQGIIKRCWFQVMNQWLENDGTKKYKATWGGVLKVLEYVEYNDVARDLKRVLASLLPPIQSPSAVPALINASQKGQFDVAKHLLENGVAVDSQNSDGQSALISASKAGHHNFAKFLLDNGAKVDLQDCHGHSALMDASKGGHRELASLLLEKNALVDLQDETGSSALMGACCNGHVNVAKLMLDKGAMVDLRANDGHTALMNACQEGHLEVAKLLLKYNASIYMQSVKWESALSLALLRCLRIEPAALINQLELVALLAGKVSVSIIMQLLLVIKQ